MKDYKVTTKVFCHMGLLPDFFGKRNVYYMKAESASQLNEMVEKMFRDNFGFELATGGITYKIDIESV